MNTAAQGIGAQTQTSNPNTDKQQSEDLSVHFSNQVQASIF